MDSRCSQCYEVVSFADLKPLSQHYRLCQSCWESRQRAQSWSKPGKPDWMIQLEQFEQQRKDEYAEYLRSDHWQRMRKVALWRWNYKCVVCGTKDNLDVHHKTYDRLGHEALEDLVVLCRSCHEATHEYLRYQKEQARLLRDMYDDY